MAVDILQAGKDDLETILKLQKECYITEAELYGDYNISPLTQDMESMEKDFETSVILKAEEKGIIVGSIRGYVENGTLYIGRLMVKQDCRNRGIAQKLLGAIESAFCDYGRCELFTGFRSEKNLYLYDKMGYKEFKRQNVDQNMAFVFLEKIKTNGA